MDAQIRKIEQIEKRKDEAEEERYFEKYGDIFKLTFQFLKRRKVLLYGGMALNELMPSKYQFYSDRTLPDIDVLALDAEKLAHDCVDFFKKKGYNKVTTNLSEALNEGTLKVFVDAVQVLDITEVLPKSFKRLSQNRVLLDKYGLYAVDPMYLRMTLHLILSKGDVATVHRWAKTLERLVLFYKAFPPKPCALQKSPPAAAQSESAAVPEALVDGIQEILVDTEYTMLGLREIEDILDMDLPEDLSIPLFTILVEDDVELVGRRIISNLKNNSLTRRLAPNNSFDVSKLKLTKVFPEDDIVSAHTILSYKDVPVAFIFNANICEGYTVYKGRRVASVHTIIRMFLSMMFSTYGHFAEYIESMECIANLLTIQSNRNRRRRSRSKLVQDVVEHCYGASTGLITMRKNRILRIKKNKRSLVGGC